MITSPTFIYQNFFNKTSETAFLWYALDINKKNWCSSSTIYLFSKILADFKIKGVVLIIRIQTHNHTSSNAILTSQSQPSQHIIRIYIYRPNTHYSLCLIPVFNHFEFTWKSFIAWTKTRFTISYKNNLKVVKFKLGVIFR